MRKIPVLYYYNYPSNLCGTCGELGFIGHLMKHGYSYVYYDDGTADVVLEKRRVPL